MSKTIKILLVGALALTAALSVGAATPAYAQTECNVVATTTNAVCAYEAAGGRVVATLVGIGGGIAVYNPSGFLRESTFCSVCYALPMTVDTEPGDMIYLTIQNGVGRAQNAPVPIPIDL